MIYFANYKYFLYIFLIAFLILVVFLLYTFWKNKIIASLFPKSVVSNQIILRSKIFTKLKTSLIIISIIISTIVLLRPQWGLKMREVHNEGSDVLIALDVSNSMLAQDVKPNRLQRAKTAIKWIAEALKGDRIGLLLFAGDSFFQCPLTTDISAFMMFLEVAGPNSVKLQGTDIGKVLQESYRVFNQKRVTSKLLVMLTDGEDHEGIVEEGIKKFNELDVSVYTIGIGRDQGDYIPASDNKKSGDIYYRDLDGKLVRTSKNPDLLKKLAHSTGGEYIDITQNLAGLQNLLEVIEGQKKSDFGSKIIKEKKEQYQIFAFILILLLSVELLLPERKKIDG